MRFLLSLTLLLLSQVTFAESSVLDERKKQEKKLKDISFSIIPHKPTYILPFVYNDKIDSYDVYPTDENGENEMQKLELKFQLSFKVPVWVDIADLPLSLYFAYTQASFWQAYNTENSSPFRETNYEPELFIAWHKDHKLGNNWALKLATLGFAHQSNGRDEPISRSWNRLTSTFLFENGQFVVGVSPWYRFEEAQETDNNPDLTDYYGHGKITLAYKVNHHTFSLMSRNNLESGFSKGALEASWGFPLHNKIRGYVQIFSGYGNSMIEYDQYTNTVGIGIILTDWL